MSDTPLPPPTLFTVVVYTHDNPEGIAHHGATWGVPGGRALGVMVGRHEFYYNFDEVTAWEVIP